MRDIRFRAWDTKGKEMVNYIHIAPEYGWLVLADNDAMAERERPERDQWIIMQYTGLKDKNGKEIFEGDIVKTFWQHDGVENYDYELVGEIVWNKEDACFSLDCSDQIIRFITTYEREELLETEVIGNIYENPDLLK